eukprot:m.159451 g.159451  ORF g.159451 m.159451 type:complete len:51 (-) comp23740_c0_seq1:2715-2867(-)
MWHAAPGETETPGTTACALVDNSLPECSQDEGRVNVHQQSNSSLESSSAS